MKRLLIAALLLGAAAARAAPVTEVHYVMGTYYRIVAEGDDARASMRPCFQDARRVEQVFSRFAEDSELTRVNQGAGAPQRVSEDFAELLARALALGTSTGGAFDVTVGALTALWRDAEGRPPATAVAAARAHVGATGLRLHDGVLALPVGQRLDFDGIAKGWTVDRCVARLRAAGVTRALVSLGESSIYALGAPAGDDAWTLEVRGVEPDEAVGVLRLRDEGLSVSDTLGGGGRRRGRAFGHIVDPRTGAALTEPAVAAVVAASATDAEAFSKALLVWGSAGVERVERLGARGAVHVAGGVAASRGARVRRLFVAFATPRPLAAGADAP